MNTVLSYGFGFAALLVARFAFGAPIWLAGLVGVAVSYALPWAFLKLGMKATRAVIERSPEGRAAMAAHDAEQATTWREWEEIKRRQKAGEHVDPAEVARIKGILFGNKGVLLNPESAREKPAATVAPVVSTAPVRTRSSSVPQPYLVYIDYVHALEALAASPHDPALIARATAAGRQHYAHHVAATFPRGGLPPELRGSMEAAMVDTLNATILQRDIDAANRGEVPQHLLARRT